MPKRTTDERLPGRSPDYQKAVRQFGAAYRGRRAGHPREITAGRTTISGAEIDAGQDPAPVGLYDQPTRDAAVAALPWYLRGIVGAIEPMTRDPGDTLLNEAEYANKVRSVREQLQQRPGEQGTGMFNPETGLEYRIPDNWDAGEFRSFVMMYKRGDVNERSDIAGGATGITGGPMSTWEAMRAAAADFREVYGDERDWENTGTVTAEFGEVNVNYPMNENIKARAAETARLTGRPQQFLGKGQLGKRQLGFMLPDKKDLAVRKAWDAVRRALEKPEDKKIARTAKQRLASLDTRPIYNTPGMTDEQVKANESVHAKIDAIRKHLAKGALSVDEAKELMTPLIKQLAEGKAVRELAAKKEKATADIQDQWKTQRQRSEQAAKIGETQAKANYEWATGDVAETQAEIKEVKAELAEARSNIEPEESGTPAHKKVAELQGRFDELKEELTTRRKAAADAREKIREAGKAVAVLYAPPSEPPTETAMRTPRGQHPLEPPIPMGPEMHAYRPAEIPASAEAYGGEGPPADVEAGDVLTGIVPGLEVGERGYDGDLRWRWSPPHVFIGGAGESLGAHVGYTADGKTYTEGVAGDARAIVEEVSATSVRVVARGPDGKKVVHEVPLAELGKYYAPQGARRPEADAANPVVGAVFKRLGTGTIATVSATSPTAVQLTWRDKGKRRDRVVSYTQLIRQWAPADGREETPTAEQLEARAKIAEIKDALWNKRKLTDKQERIFDQLAPPDRSELVNWILTNEIYAAAGVSGQE